MLRIGIPKGTDSHQAKGVTKISQTFTSDGSDIGLAYRIFTWEHKDTDVLVIDVKQGTKSVGRLADKEIQGITPTSVVTGAGTLPYTLDLNVEPRQAKFLATPWQDVRITDLPSGQLTITYTLDTNTTAAHDSWIYLDLVDIVKPTVSISSPANGTTVTTRTPHLDFTANDDQWGSGIAAGSARVSIDDGDPIVPPATLPELRDGAHHITVTVKDHLEGNSGSATSEFTVTTDSVAPMTSATATGTLGDNGWYTGPVAVSLEAQDNPDGSGLGTTFYRIGAGAPQIYGGAPFFVANDGANEVEYWSVDLAGNDETAKPLVVKIDDQLPVVTLTSRNDGDPRYNRPVFDFGAADACSRLASGPALRLSRYDPDKQDWRDAYALEATSGEPLLEPLDDGTYEFSITARDNAGNVGSASYRFSVEAPPIIVAAASPWEGDIVGLYTGPAWIPDEGGSLGSLAWNVTNPAEPEPVTFHDPFGFVVLDTKTDYGVI